ncbi:MAG: hypothetical protein HY046_00595 [Acidobacteria bacterium]|nr:hypothetical protein [Acidobacteriota bacterium]
MQGLLEGQQIQHDVYGSGVIRESDAERTTIDFDAHGMKKFVTELMKVEFIGEAPVKTKSRRGRRPKKAKEEVKVAA